MIAAFLTTILFSLSAVTGVRTARAFGSTAGNFWRLCVAGLTLGLYSHWQSTGLHTAAFPLLFLSGCVGFGLGDIALYHAYPRIGSRLTLLLVQCLAAPFGAMAEWLWLGETLTPGQAVGGGIILLGVGMALAPDEKLKASGRTLVTGMLLGVVGAFGQGFGAVMSRFAYHQATLAGEVAPDGLSAAYQRILGGLMISGLFLLWVQRKAFFVRTLPEAQTPSPWKTCWKLPIVNGLAGPAFGVACYQWALLNQPTGVVLPIVALTPLVVIPFTYFFEGERPSMKSLMGGVVAVLGTLILTWQTTGG